VQPESIGATSGWLVVPGGVESFTRLVSEYIFIFYFNYCYFFLQIISLDQTHDAMFLISTSTWISIDLYSTTPLKAPTLIRMKTTLGTDSMLQNRSNCG
jgi:hypothetical protein